MDEKLMQKILKDNKVTINVILSICVFIGTGLYFLTPFREWEQIKLDIHNFYLSVQLPKTCKIVEYSTVTRSGKPVIRTRFISDEELNVEKLKKQLLMQKWLFVKEHGEKDGKWKVFEYDKQGYSYQITITDEGKWGESLNSEK